jgi:hypothetical protein
MSERSQIRPGSKLGDSISVFRNPILQRKCDCGQHTGAGGECEECKKKKILQRQGTGWGGPSIAPPIVHDVIRSAGQPLDPETKSFFEPRFGRDFSGVRVHTDSRAAESARAVDALAYTVGNKVVFGRGRYQPRTDEGRELLAHELTHTVQQSSSPDLLSGPIPVSGVQDKTEDEAGRVAADLSAGTGVSAVQGSPRLSRQAAATTNAGDSTPASGNSAGKGTETPHPPKKADLQGEAGVKRNNFGVFDTLLDRTQAAKGQPCRQELQVNIKFNPQGPWPPGSFAKWQQDFVRIVTNRWSFRYMLAPDKPCADEPCKSAVAVLKVVPTNATADNIIQVKVDYNKPAGTRSDVHHLYAADVKSQGNDLRRSHVTASHEAGHMLGLQHIHCNTNADDCYGTSDEESADVMGRGEIVSERDYEPFVEAISRLTGCKWKTVGHGGGSLFGSSWVGPLAVLGGLGGALGGALAGASLGLGGALGFGALFGALGAGFGAATGASLNEVAR